MTTIVIRIHSAVLSGARTWSWAPQPTVSKNIAKCAALFVLLMSPGLLRAQDRGSFFLHDGDRVVFYGDSITKDGGYANLVEAYARSRFPAWDLRFYYSGVGGDSVAGGVRGDIGTRLERDVVPVHPTVVTLMLGMNDGQYRTLETQTLDRFTAGYRSIVDLLGRDAPKARLVPILPSPFDDITRKPQFGAGYDQVLRRLGQAVEAIAAEKHLTTVDFGAPLNAAIARILKTNPELARTLLPDRVHPSVAAHLILGAALLHAWHAPSLVTRVGIDATSGAISASENTKVSGWEAGPGSFKWRQFDGSLPLPIDYDNEAVALAIEAGADLESLDLEPLAVTGLGEGSYRLAIDGQAIGVFTAHQLASGINLAHYNTPMRWQAFSVVWGATGSAETQRVRQSLMSGGFSDPGGSIAVQTLATFDEKDQAARMVSAAPRERTYVLSLVTPDNPSSK